MAVLDSTEVFSTGPGKISKISSIPDNSQLRPLINDSSELDLLVCTEVNRIHTTHESLLRLLLQAVQAPHGKLERLARKIDV